MSMSVPVSRRSTVVFVLQSSLLSLSFLGYSGGYTLLCFWLAWFLDVPIIHPTNSYLDVSSTIL